MGDEGTSLVGATEGAIGDSWHYRWLPRPPAEPADRTPYAPCSEAAPDAATASFRLLRPPLIGDRVGGPVFAAAVQDTAAEKESPAKRRSVIVVGEWWGIDTHVLQLGRTLAAAGFDVLCLDIFRDGPEAIPVDVTRSYDTTRGLREAFTESAHKMSTCDWTSALVDVAAAAAWLRHGGPTGTDAKTASDSVAIVGCSFGAVLALLAAASSTAERASDTRGRADDQRCSIPINAAVAFYGLPDDRFTGGSASLWDPEHVAVPCQLHFPSAAPGLDGFDDVSRGRELLGKLPEPNVGQPGGGSHELHEYLVR
jgi:dienelactone hydrolase